MDPDRLWVEVGDRKELDAVRRRGVAAAFVVGDHGSPIYGRPGDRLVVRIGERRLAGAARVTAGSLPARAGAIVPATATGLALLAELRGRGRSPLAVSVGTTAEVSAAREAGADSVVVLAAGAIGAVLEASAGRITVVAAASSVAEAEAALAAGADGLLVPAEVVAALLESAPLAARLAPPATPLRTPNGRAGATPRPGTIGAALERTVRAHGPRDAMVHVAAGRRWSYAALRDEVRRTAAAMLAVGIRPGDRVTIWARNVPEWPIVQLACATVGAVMVTANPSLTEEEIAFVLAQSGSSLLFAAPRTPAQTTMIEQLARGAAPHDLRAIVLLPDAAHGDGPRSAARPGSSLDWTGFLAGAVRVRDAELAAVAARVQPDDVVMLLYTSGTTGFPKGAMLTHRGMLQNAAAVGGNLRLRPDDRICLAVPFHHCFGSVMGTLAAITYGAALVVPDDRFDAGATLGAVARERCTVLYGVPTMFLAELEHPDRARTDLASLRTGIVAGAPVPQDLAERIVNDLHVPGLVVAYGLTEASPVVTQTSPSDPPGLRLGTVGRPIPGAEVRIVDPSTGRPVGPGETGELCTRGAMVMRGYFDMPDESAAAIDREGWLHTGDLASRDAHGYVRIVGRLKDMIIRAGENVYPAEIEAVARRHPGVADAQIVGVPSEYLGEEVVAFIRLEPGLDVGEDELRRHFAEHLASFKVPRAIRFVDDFPMTGSGKVQKHRLRELAMSTPGSTLAQPPARPPGSGPASGTTPPPLPLFPPKGAVAAPLEDDPARQPSRPPSDGWSRPATPGWTWRPDEHPTTEAQEATVTPDQTRRRGQRIKTWGIGGNVREQIEGTGEVPIMYRALGTAVQTHHPFNLYFDIKSQPDALRGTFESSQEIVVVAQELARRDPIGLIGLGSGTSQFVAQVANAAFARFAGFPGWDYDSLAFLRHTPPVDFNRYAVMAYSGSGSTVDTVAAARGSREAGAYTIAFTSIEGSPVVQASDARILTSGGFDTGGSDTFHYTTRVAAAIYLALEVGKIRRPGAFDYQDLQRQLVATAAQMADIFEAVDARCQTIAERFREVRSILVVGAGANYGTAEEIALKFDEMAHIPTKPMNPGRHIHGALGLTDEQILTVLIAPPGPSYKDLHSIAKVTQLLKTPAVAIVSDDDTEIADIVDYVVRLPVRDETIFSVLAVLPGQLLPYWCGVGLGLNPDTQRSNVPKHARVWNLLFPPGTH
jgi:fatty-acyl-CoA synthase